jgi:hypothetical protein
VNPAQSAAMTRASWLRHHGTRLWVVDVSDTPQPSLRLVAIRCDVGPVM